MDILESIESFLPDEDLDRGIVIEPCGSYANDVAKQLVEVQPMDENEAKAIETLIPHSFKITPSKKKIKKVRKKMAKSSRKRNRKR